MAQNTEKLSQHLIVIIMIIFIAITIAPQKTEAKTEQNPHNALEIIFETDEYVTFWSNIGMSRHYDGTPGNMLEFNMHAYLHKTYLRYSAIRKHTFLTRAPISNKTTNADTIGANIGVLWKTATQDSVINFNDHHKKFIERKLIPAVQKSGFSKDKLTMNELQINYYIQGYAIPKQQSYDVEIAKTPGQDISTYMRFEVPLAATTFKIINGKPAYSMARTIHFDYSMAEEIATHQETQEIYTEATAHINKQFIPIHEGYYKSPSEKEMHNSSAQNKAPAPTIEDMRLAILRAMSQNNNKTISTTKAFIRGGAFSAVQAIIEISDIQIIKQRRINAHTFESDIKYNVSWQSRKSFLNHVYPANFKPAQTWPKTKTHRFALQKGRWVSTDLMLNNLKNMLEHQKIMAEVLEPEQ